MKIWLAALAILAPLAAQEASLYSLTSEWINQRGETLRWDSLKDGKSRVVAMGYSTCKGICPRIIADMQRIENSLTPAEKESTNFVFLSVAPNEDGVKELEALVKVHGLSQRWTVLTGNDDGVLEMAVALGIQFTKLPDGVNYAHAYLIAILDPAGQVIHKWTNPESGSEPSLNALRNSKD